MIEPHEGDVLVRSNKPRRARAARARTAEGQVHQLSQVPQEEERALTPPTAAERTCAECGISIRQRHPAARFCSPQCRYRFRDRQPATRKADRDRHRKKYPQRRSEQLGRAAERYRMDPEYRELMKARSRDHRQRRKDGVGICGVRGCTRDHRTAGICGPTESETGA